MAFSFYLENEITCLIRFEYPLPLPAEKARRESGAAVLKQAAGSGERGIRNGGERGGEETANPRIIEEEFNHKFQAPERLISRIISVYRKTTLDLRITEK